VIDGETAMGAIAQSVSGDWVAGMASTRRDDGVPVRWNLRTGEAQAYPKYGLAGGSVSADGRLTAAGGGGRAVLLGPRQTTTLRQLAGSSRDTAEAISRDGRSIAGNAASAPVVWRC
jgi:hypothetical protein